MANSVVGQLSVPAWGDSAYWLQSRRPLTSLVFILPALVAYEGGVMLLGPQAMRNGADIWLRGLLEWFGFGQYFLLPLLTASLLLAWHHATREPWQIEAGVLPGMLLECVVLGLALVTLGRLQGALLQAIPGGTVPGHSLSTKVPLDWHPAADWSISGRVVGFLGAGIYEELLFRLMLLPLVAALLRWAHASPCACLIGAITITSVAFSACALCRPAGRIV